MVGLALIPCFFIITFLIYFLLFLNFFNSMLYKQDRGLPKIFLKLAPVCSYYPKTNMTWLIPVPLITWRRRPFIRVITLWIVNILQTHSLTCCFKLARVCKVRIIVQLVREYGLIIHSRCVLLAMFPMTDSTAKLQTRLIMHSKTAIRRVFCQRHNDLIAVTF